MRAVFPFLMPEQLELDQCSGFMATVLRRSTKNIASAVTRTRISDREADLALLSVVASSQPLTEYKLDTAGLAKPNEDGGHLQMEYKQQIVSVFRPAALDKKPVTSPSGPADGSAAAVPERQLQERARDRQGAGRRVGHLREQLLFVRDQPGRHEDRAEDLR